MKTHFFLLAVVMLGCQKRQNDSVVVCHLPDIDRVGSVCDSLRSVGMHSKAAQLYFSTGDQNHSSELFVYAAWQFNEAGNTDSALISVQRAIEYGMDNPHILTKLGIEDMDKQRDLRKEIEQNLKIIGRKNRSIDNFKIVTSPIDNFWNYFDQALQDTTKAREYLSAFICNGSHAIKDYYHIRYGNIENMYQTMIVRNPEYYTYVKNLIASDKLDAVSREAGQMMVRFSNIYPKAVFPKVYLVPGLINSSGTLTEAGLFIGVDMFAKSENMPLSNLNDWQIDHISNFEEMKYHLVHELMHFQQSYQDTENRQLLLGKLIEEGACDFLLTLLIDDGEMSSSLRYKLEYLENPENLKFILTELRTDLYSEDLSKWMYNGGAIKDRPSDLGYSIGYLICKSYYDKSEDKEKAVYELLNTSDFRKIIEKSRFRNILQTASNKQ